MIIKRDLRGWFKWVVVDEDLTIVDPRYYDEYKAKIMDKQ